MACGSSVSSRSLDIERALRKDFAEYRRELKLLLLGTGECGKSTIIKQMRIIHTNGFEAKEREGFKTLMYRNILRSTKALLDAQEALKLPLTNEALLDAAYVLLDTPEDSYLSITADVAFYKQFWADRSTLKCFARRNEFQLSDSTPYFFEHLDRIASDGYLPTDQDILRAREPTTGIHEIVVVPDKRVVFRVLDVGGQRSERRKWIHCFENITSIIFIVASSEFNQNLVEENVTNRMVESISLFEQIINYHWFRETSFILFLNKVDLLHKKVVDEHADISVHFPEFKQQPGKSASNVEHVKEFILKMYMSHKPPTHDVYPHWTQATDTEQTRIVLKGVNDTLIRLHMKEYNLI